jgi:hypothetical protein
MFWTSRCSAVHVAIAKISLLLSYLAEVIESLSFHLDHLITLAKAFGGVLPLSFIPFTSFRHP